MTRLDRSLSLRWLLSPLSPADFLANHRGRGPLHLPGPEDKFARVFSWDALSRLLGPCTALTGEIKGLFPAGANPG